jgi:hypothetical protein
MKKMQRESLRHVLATVGDNPKLAAEVQMLLPLLDPPRRKQLGIVPRNDQTHIPI